MIYNKVDTFDFREKQGIKLPEFGRYATGILFLEKTSHKETEAAFEKIAEECNLRVWIIFLFSISKQRLLMSISGLL